MHLTIDCDRAAKPHDFQPEGVKCLSCLSTVRESYSVLYILITLSSTVFTGMFGKPHEDVLAYSKYQHSQKMHHSHCILLHG